MTRRSLTILMTALALSLIALPASAHSSYVTNENDAGPGSFRAAIERANVDCRVDRIVFKHGVHEVALATGIVYSGSQSLAIQGRLAVITSAGGAFDLFTSSGGGNLTLSSIDFEGGGASGVVVDVPVSATGDQVVVLNDVTVADQASFGVHIDDAAGSAAGIFLLMVNTSILNNGIAGGLDDVDGVRVDEAGPGDIVAVVTHSEVSGNAFDGIELDESGAGDVAAMVTACDLSDNGFGNASYDETDDGFDIDEADAGDLTLSVFFTSFANNGDQGLDLDEEGDGDLNANVLLSSLHDNGEEGMKSTENDDGETNVRFDLSRIENNGGDGAKIEENDDGDLNAHFNHVKALGNGSDGVQLEEKNDGDVDATVARSVLSNNDKDGLKADQKHAGQGFLEVDNHTRLEGNGDDAIDLEGITLF